MKQKTIKKMSLGIRKEINGISYLFWNRFYWLEVGQLKCFNCERKYVKYKKFWYRLGELKERRQYDKYCSDCQTVLENYEPNK